MPLPKSLQAAGPTAKPTQLSPRSGLWPLRAWAFPLGTQHPWGCFLSRDPRIFICTTSRTITQIGSGLRLCQSHPKACYENELNKHPHHHTCVCSGTGNAAWCLLSSGLTPINAESDVLSMNTDVSLWHRSSNTTAIQHEASKTEEPKSGAALPPRPSVKVALPNNPVAFH